MGNARRYECFCVEPTERWLYAGNISGQISVIDIDRFTILRHVQAHSGVVRSITAHPTLPYIAAMATDFCVSIWKRTEDGMLLPLTTTSIRDAVCTNDQNYIAPIVTHSVALAFHDTLPRLVTRSGNGGVLELDFSDIHDAKTISCVRFHGEWDVQMTRYVSGSDQVLSAGRDGCLVLSDTGREMHRWTFWDTVAHWAEYLGGSTYLLASDAGRVARIDLEDRDSQIMGERFAHDDMEQVTFNETSQRAFASSFDRNVYEIDPVTCRMIRVVYSPGYKCIWLKTLERAPDVLLVHSRNGGIYKANLSNGNTLGIIKETPDALWTAVHLPGGDILLAGEGAHLTRITIAGIDHMMRTPQFSVTRIGLAMPTNTYTKRMVRQKSTGLLVLARTDGDIWVGSPAGFRLLVNLGSAVRDIAVSPVGHEIFASTEDGRLLKLHCDTGELLAEFRVQGTAYPRPIWALSYNPEANLIAFAEFGGTLRVASANDLTVVREFICNRVKRIRWTDQNTLLFGNTDEIYRYHLCNAAPDPLVASLSNTVEDFIWDFRKQFLVAISYQSTITLCDFQTGTVLDSIRDQMDYSKGITWADATLDDDLYPWDFMTFGRTGNAHLYRIHDDKIMALGPVDHATIVSSSNLLSARTMVTMGGQVTMPAAVH